VVVKVLQLILNQVFHPQRGGYTLCTAQNGKMWRTVIANNIECQMAIKNHFQ
jgi:hypothetical protein